MSPEGQAILEEWSAPVGVDIFLAVAVLVYFRGWMLLRRSAPAVLSGVRLVSYLSGICALWIAIGSPLAAFDEVSLTVHMIQHLLLMLIVPPLLLLGTPALPYLHGLPQIFVRNIFGPFFRLPWVQRIGGFLTHPAFCWLLASVTMIVWHIPSAFELALHSETWHEIEHFCFLSTSILFWWPVVQPFPSQAHWSRWTVPIYLLLAMFPGGALGAFLTFYDSVIYSSYTSEPPIFGISPLTDQVLAGVLMWVSGIFIFVVPAVLITFRLLAPASSAARLARP